MTYTKEEIKHVINEVDYYLDKKCTEQEAKEILWYVKTNHASLQEVIQDYYSC